LRKIELVDFRREGGARSGAFFSRGWSSFCGRPGHEGLDAFAVSFQEGTEFFGEWEGDEVAGDEEFIFDPSGGDPRVGRGMNSSDSV
jgi:hypothetical protein